MSVPQKSKANYIRGYDLREQIGEGGFGAVYRAYQPSVGREVAIKIIQPEYANRPDFVRRFEAEAQIVARLEHFHIVPLYDYWRDPDGAYFVMRYLRGGTVRDMLGVGSLPLPLVLRIVSQMASALNVAHRNNVIHRDIKPDNIMLDIDQNAYLADFGIAKLLEDGYTDVDTQMIVGSPAYASPEQIRSRPVTPFSDQYSLGVLLYEILAGAHPFGDIPVTAMFAKHIEAPLPSIRRHRDDLPPDIDTLLRRATQKEPDDRYPTVQEMALHLRDILTDSDVIATVIGGSPQGSTTVKFDVTPSRRETVELAMEWDEVSNPFKGLRAFQEADSADFFGRENLVDQLVGHLQTPEKRFLALVGPSGSGKSSVIKAGLIPAIKAGRLPGSEAWFVVEMFPGAYPLEELEAALLRVSVRPVDSLLDVLKQGPDGLKSAVDQIMPQDESELLLYIDQFEEAFTFVEQENERTQLLDVILGAATAPDSRVRVVVTLRADFYDRPLLYPQFGEMFRQNTEVVLPMNREELEAAITGPAEAIKMRVEPSLIQAIVSDVEGQPGGLPLLQYALTELFERRDGPILTLQSYTEIGGALGALARRADDIYMQLDEQDRDTTRQLFLRLVTLGEGTEDTRRRVLRSELISLAGDDDAMERTVNLFSRYRLLTLDRDANTREPTVEIAHESLIREWSKLRDWLNTSRTDMRMQRRVMDAATDWERYGEDRSYLARGAQLETFEKWVTITDLQLTNLEKRYLSASITRRDEVQAAEAAQQAREKALETRSRNILRALVAVLVVALAVAIGLSAFALRARNDAQQAATIADRAAEYSRSSSLAAQSRLALLNRDVDLAVTLALEANRIDNPPPIAQNMLFDVAYAPGTSYFLRVAETDINAAVTLNNGDVAFAARNGQVGVWSPVSGEVRILVAPGGATATTLAANPSSNEILVGFGDGALMRFDAATGDMLAQFGVTTLAGSNSVTAAIFSRDLSSAFVGLQNGDLLLLDFASGEVRQRFGSEADGHEGAITAIRLSPDNQTLLTSSVDGTVRLWDLPAGGPRFTLGQHSSPVRDVAFNPDGTQFASIAQNGEIFLWDTISGELVRRLQQTTGTLWSLAYGPDGTILTGGQDGRLRQWDVMTGDPLATYQGHTNTILDISPSTEAGNVVTAAADGTLRVWNFYNRQLAYIVEDTGSTRGGVFSLDIHDGTVVAGGAFGSLNLYDALTGEKDTAADQRIVTFNTSFTKLTFVREGTQVLTGSLDGGLNLWDIATGSQVGSFGRHRGAVQALAAHPQALEFASASRDETLRIWDLAAGDELIRLVDGEFTVTSLAYSPTGDALLAGTADGNLVLYDTDAYEPIYTIRGAFEREVSAVAFDTDELRFAAGSLDQTAKVFDRASGDTIQRLLGHEDPIQTVTFFTNVDGLLTASGNVFADDVDVSLRLWDISTGQQLSRFGDEHTQEINDLVYSPEDNGLISADGNSDIIRYNMLSLPELIAFTEANRYARPLTCGEQALYDLDRGNCP
jgi:WD40 repeat protein/serine/threonine protein kinase